MPKALPEQTSHKTGLFHARNFHCVLAVFLILLVSACATMPSSQKTTKAEAHNELGLSYLNNGQLNEAFIEFQKAVKLNPRNRETLNYLGYINYRFKQYDEAIAYYKKAISIDGDYSEALNNLGVTYAEMGQWDDAIHYFEDAVENPFYRTPEMAYSNMGYALYMKGDYKIAVHAVQEALLRNPSFSRAIFTLGLIYTELDLQEEAIVEFKKAIGLSPDFMEAHLALAKAYLKTGNNAKALKHFQAIVDQDEDSARIREASQYIQRLKY